MGLGVLRSSTSAAFEPTNLRGEHVIPRPTLIIIRPRGKGKYRSTENTKERIWKKAGVFFKILSDIPVGMPTHRWEDIVRMDLRDIVINMAQEMNY